MRNILQPLFFLFLVNFPSLAIAQTGSACETYSHVQLQEKYNANFLNKEYQGCFSYSVDPSNRKSPEAMMSIRLGDHLTSIDNINNTKIAYEAFRSFVNTYKNNRALSQDVDRELNVIRTEAKLAANKIDNDLAHFKSVYNSDAIPQLKENQANLKIDATALVKKAEAIDKKSLNLSSNIPNILYPKSPSEVSKTISNPIDKEKERWSSLKNHEFIPFRSLNKISLKNKTLANKLLKEIKIERYNQLGLTQVENLPTLRQVQRYENKENLYNQKFELIKGNPSLTSAYSSSELQTIKEIAKELKNESENKLIAGELENANDSIDTAYLALDIATSIPIIASGRGLYELYTGKSLIDGHELTKTEMGIAGGMILLDLTPVSVITRGAGFVATLGKAGTRLAERGIIEAGFGEGLNLSVKYADAFAASANQLIQQGVVKYETIKKVVDYNLFLKFIEKETYFATKNYADKILRFENVSARLAKEGIDASPNLNQYVSNLIQYNETFIADEMILENSRRYLNLESKFSSLKPTSTDDLVVSRGAYRKYTEHPFETNKDWFFSNMSTEHRYSMKGEPALYTVIGSNDNSINAAMAEIEAASNMAHTVALESKSFSSNKVLDLTDPKNLEILGITKNDLIDDYTLPQILSHLAKMNQYDSIIAFGAKEYIHGTNIGLEYYRNYIILRGF